MQPKLKPKFARFLEIEFIHWQAAQGRRVSLDEFAAYLGISRPLLSHYLNGIRLPSHKVVSLLAAKLGPGTYVALAWTPEEILTAVWEGLAESQQRQLLDYALQLLAQSVKADDMTPVEA